MHTQISKACVEELTKIALSVNMAQPTSNPLVDIAGGAVGAGVGLTGLHNLGKVVPALARPGGKLGVPVAIGGAILGGLGTHKIQQGLGRHNVKLHLY